MVVVVVAYLVFNVVLPNQPGIIPACASVSAVTNRFCFVQITAELLRLAPVVVHRARCVRQDFTSGDENGVDTDPQAGVRKMERMIRGQLCFGVLESI